MSSPFNRHFFKFYVAFINVIFKSHKYKGVYTVLSIWLYLKRKFNLNNFLSKSASLNIFFVVNYFYIIDFSFLKKGCSLLKLKILQNQFTNELVI